MTWLTPMLAVWAAAAAIPALLLLYFLKLKRREVEVSTTILWKRAVQDLRANAPFQRLRRNILLLLQLVALALALAALGQPELRAEAPSATRHVLLIDRSASMSAIDADAASRLDAAKRDAIAFVDAMREGSASLGGLLERLTGGGKADEAMVIAFDAGAEVRQAFTRDKAQLRAAIRAIEPSDAPARLDPALRLAGVFAAPIADDINEGERDDAQAAPSASLRLWSDGLMHDAAQSLPPAAAHLRYERVGDDATTNTGIVSFRAQRAYDDPAAVSLFVSVQSTDPGLASTDVELLIDGSPVAVRAVPLNEVSQGGADLRMGGAVFTIRREQGGVATVRIATGDALGVDDEARLALPPAQRLSVALVTGGNLLLQSALEGLPLSRLVILTPQEFESGARTASLADIDVFVLDALAPPLVGDAVAPGRYLVLNETPHMAGLTPGQGATDRATVPLDWDRDHPVLRMSGLDRLVVARQRLMHVSPPAVTLAETEHGPLIAEAYDAAARAIVVAFDPAQSTWPFDFGYVLFLASSVQRLGDIGEGRSVGGLRPGDTLTARLPAGAQGVELRTPWGDRVPLTPSPDAGVSYGPLRRAGVYELRWRGPADPRDIGPDGAARRLFAVNLDDPEESRLGSRESLALASRTVEASEAGAGGSSRRRLWPWLLCAALGVLMLEWFVYNRRVSL